VDYSPKSAEVSAAPDVPQSVIDAHAADVASARGLESSRVVSADDSGPVPIPVAGAVPQPVGEELFEPTLPEPTVDPDQGPDPVLSPPVVDREVTEFDPATGSVRNFV
jgi:hypothetical protein